MTGRRSPSAETDRLPPAPECPFCGTDRTELTSAFGSQVSVATYWCSACRSPFELIRWRGGSGSEAPTPDPATGSDRTQRPGTAGDGGVEAR